MLSVVLATADINRLAAGDASASSLPGMALLMAGVLVLASAKALGSTVKIIFVTLAILLALIATTFRLFVVLLLSAFLVAAVLLNADTVSNPPTGVDPPVSTQVHP